jgi:flavodoxin I
MKALVIYDSAYGNTEQVAQAIGASIGAVVRLASDVRAADLDGVELLVVGSPTHGGWPGEALARWLKTPPRLEGVKVAAFDTRVDSKLGRALFGFAAPRMARMLEKSGGRLVTPPEGFFVLGDCGPLKAGELERAAEWAKRMQS